MNFLNDNTFKFKDDIRVKKKQRSNTYNIKYRRSINNYHNSTEHKKKLKEDNDIISLNKENLYDTFSLFQQFLKKYKIENNNDNNGKVDQKAIGDKIQKFLFGKKKENNTININQNIGEYNTAKNEKNNKTDSIKIQSADNLDEYNNDNFNSFILNKCNTNIDNKIYENHNKRKNINSYNKTEKFQNLVLSYSIENNKSDNINSKLSKKKINLKEYLNCNNNNRNYKMIYKTTNNTIENENEKNNILNSVKYKCETFRNKDINDENNNNTILKNNTFTNKFNDKMKVILKKKFKKDFLSKNTLVLDNNKTQKYNHDNYNKSFCNSCTSFFKKKVFENNINTSISPKKHLEKKLTLKLKNNTNIINRNKIDISMSKIKSSKSENFFEFKNYINKSNIKKENYEKKTNKLLKNKKDNININLNINQEINNINYSSENQIIKDKYNKLINIKKNNDNPNSDNLKSGHSYSNKTMNFDSINNNITNRDNHFNNNKNVVMTEIKVKKKNNNSSKGKIIELKIKELNDEIEKFKEEKNKIILLKNEYEKLSKKLTDDIIDFNRKKEEFEKYKQSEIETIKNKKINSSNLNINYENYNKIINDLKGQNQLLIQNSKNDKEIIKQLKIKINDLENIIKQKDNEKKKNKNNNNNNNFINSHKKLLDYKKINTKKNIKNINSKKDLGCDIKKLFKTKILNSNDSLEKYKDINNYTVSNNFSKKIFDNINKNLKIEPSNIINISFNEREKYKNNKQKESNNNINKNIKSNLNDINKGKINNKGYISINENIIKNEKNKKIDDYTQKNLSLKRINIPNINLDFSQDIKEFNETTIENNQNYNTCNEENNAFKNLKKIQIKKIQKNSNIILPNKIKNNQSKGESKLINSFKKIKKKFTIDDNLNDKKNKIINKNKEITKENTYNYHTNNFIGKNSLSNKKKEEINNNNTDNNFEFVIINNDSINEKEDNNIYDFIIPEKYINNKYELLKSMESDGKIINIYSNNKREIIFQSGLKKEIFEDGFHLVYFQNGDKKQIYPDGKTIYYFNDSKTVQTSFSDGLNIFKFSNGQIEKHFSDGSKFIIFPNGSKRMINKDGFEENYSSEEDEEQILKRNRNEDIFNEFTDMENKRELFMSYNSIDSNED